MAIKEARQINVRDRDRDRDRKTGRVNVCTIWLSKKPGVMSETETETETETFTERQKDRGRVQDVAVKKAKLINV